jgi:hypothetical protein
MIHRIDGPNDHETACGIRREPPFDLWPDDLQLTTGDGWSSLVLLDKAPEALDPTSLEAIHDQSFILPDFDLCSQCKSVYSS